MGKESDHKCVIIGASHAGVNCAFALRKQGWLGEIHLFDADPALPYHRPPLSKDFLCQTEDYTLPLLKSEESYKKEHIRLHLGIRVASIHPEIKSISLEDGHLIKYEKLVIATGARAKIPSIPGLDSIEKLFVLRNKTDTLGIRQAYQEMKTKRVLIIGGGFIGLETAASLRKQGAEVQILEREDRVLKRVTAPEMSAFFQSLHIKNGVQIHTQKHVQILTQSENHCLAQCEDESEYEADMLIIGVGVDLNTEMAVSAGLEVEDGIAVDQNCRTSNPNIFAIGDCTRHYTPHYDRHIRLESVQNAVDQAKVAAAALCGKATIYDRIPWFWSDQYDVKLQMVGLSEGYTEALIRKETDENRFSIWYFRHEELLAVDAVNQAKAYALGSKMIKMRKTIHKGNLRQPEIPLKPANLLLQES